MERTALPVVGEQVRVAGVLLVPDATDPGGSTMHLVLSGAGPDAVAAPALFEGTLRDFATLHYPLRGFPEAFRYFSRKGEGAFPEERVRVLHGSGGGAPVPRLPERPGDLEPFLYGFWHDLQNALVAVEGYAALIEASGELADGGKASTYLGRIRANFGRMDELLGSLERLLRTGSPTAPPQEVDLNEVLGRAAEEAGASSGVGPEVRVQGTLPRVPGDPVSLHQVLANLLSNAWKYRHPDRPCVVTVGCRERRRSYRIFVRDNGRGIPPDEQERVFQIFRRAAGGEAGRGVGLYTVRRLVQAHGGRVWVTSIHGEGSTFHITLPAAPQMALPFGAGE